jgi:hypothetical protein
VPRENVLYQGAENVTSDPFNHVISGSTNVIPGLDPGITPAVGVRGDSRIKSGDDDARQPPQGAGISRIKSRDADAEHLHRRAGTNAA